MTSSNLKLTNILRFFGASGAAGDRNEPIIGIFWVTVAMAFLAGIVTLGRYLALEGMDPSQVMFFRNFFCVVLMLPLLAWRGSSLWKTDQLKLYGARVFFSFISMTGMFHAVALIPISEVTAIGFLSPLFATLFAIVLLGERVRLRRWTALLIGFLGALVMLRPGLSPTGLGQLFALISALSLGAVGPLVKKITSRDDADRVVFLTNLILTPISLVPALFVWQWPELYLWPALVGIGLCAVLGHMALVRGYASTEASLVQTFKFSRLPFAAILGIFVLNEGTDSLTWVGAGIIFSAAVYITRREAQLKTAAR
ncbi:MAG: DMT family transporter [Hyphomicrobiaceae bacterium]